MSPVSETATRRQHCVSNRTDPETSATNLDTTSDRRRRFYSYQTKPTVNLCDTQVVRSLTLRSDLEQRFGKTRQSAVRICNIAMTVHSEEAMKMRILEKMAELKRLAPTANGHFANCAVV